jgi:formate hydrogenlyase subunit 6/NADH:ubiquinone oxidoreductase subunit I
MADEQDGGTYRLVEGEDGSLFGFAVGPQSWKQYLYPPSRRLYTSSSDGVDLGFTPDPETPTKYAFIGVRACELTALEIHDNVFLHGEHVDSWYQMGRNNAFIIAVNCARPSGTCFCASMNTGPGVRSGYDLALTELPGNDEHKFAVSVGSGPGRVLLMEVPHREATDHEAQAADRVVEEASAKMGRHMNTHGVPELLAEASESPHWEEVAERCMACANCTMVCPTCFCSTVEDTTSLKGDQAERWRLWDSCFSLDYSYIHGGSVRTSGAARYRQWITHKLSSWHDQFDTSGCVGCGRCITWCPVGIDITEEVAALQHAQGGAAVEPSEGVVTCP